MFVELECVGYLVHCFVVSSYAKVFFMHGWVQVESRIGHMSISWFGQSVQLGLGYVSGQKMLFQFLPMYWASWNFKLV